MLPAAAEGRAGVTGGAPGPRNVPSDSYVHDVESRVLSLMLLWRRSVLLFHDVHHKAARALPGLWRATGAAGIVWTDCAEYLPAAAETGPAAPSWPR